MSVEFGQSIKCESCNPGHGPDDSIECDFCPTGQMITNVERFQSENPVFVGTPAEVVKFLEKNSN